MRPKSRRSFGYVLFVLSIVILPAAFAQNRNADDNSLADVARGLRDQRAGNGLAPVRTFTNDDLSAPTTEGSLAKNRVTPSPLRGTDPASSFNPEDDYFRPPEAERVVNIVKPTATFGYGSTVLDVLISEKGEVEDVEVRRNLPSLTDVAIRSIRTWTFQPAQENDRAVASRITVAVSFNTESNLVSGEANLPLPPLIHQSDEARIQSDYQPPEVTFGPLPAFPVTTRCPETVFLQATVDTEGKPQDVTVLREAAPSAPAAEQAAEAWRVIPATFASLSGFPVAPFGPGMVMPATFPPLPAFPIAAVGPGTLIPQQTPNTEGKPQDATPLREAAPFGPSAVHAAEAWRFIPATLNGVPVKAKVMLVFVFTPQMSQNY